MPRRIKKPKQIAKGKGFAYPVSIASPPMKGFPLFSLHYLQDNYCITKCGSKDKIAFTDTLRCLSKMTWNQIYSAPKHGLGAEKIKRACFQVNIPAIIPEDANFYAIRFSGNKAMVGFRIDDAYHIVWFDRNYTVYNHGD